MKKSYLNNIMESLKIILKTITWFIALFVLLLVIHVTRRIFIADTFRIPTQSMIPTLLPGDKVICDKLTYGARIYTSFDFSEHAPLCSFRMPGVRKIRPGDVIVFNFPFGYDDWYKIEFKINYVYCKRVVGCPGDRIGILDGHCWNDRILRPIGLVEKQEELRFMYDSLLIWSDNWDAIPRSTHRWNVKNMGPLTVPSKGISVGLDTFTAELYRQVIEYETGEQLECDTASCGGIQLGGKQVEQYTFQQDWYFALGDNSFDSQDSRYWGFIPDDFIIGVVRRVLFSKDLQNGRFRWDRTLKRI